MTPPCCASITTSCWRIAEFHKQFDVNAANGAMNGPSLPTTRKPLATMAPSTAECLAAFRGLALQRHQARIASALFRAVAVREHGEEEPLHAHLDLGAHAGVLNHRRTAYDVSADRVALVDEGEAPIGGIRRSGDETPRALGPGSRS